MNDVVQSSSERRYRVTCALCMVTGMVDGAPSSCGHCGLTMLLVTEVAADAPDVVCQVVEIRS